MGTWHCKIDLNRMFTLQPTRPNTVFGIGSITRIDAILSDLAQAGRETVLVVTDGLAAKASGAWEAVRPALDAQVAWLQRYPNVTVRIEGNADERGTREYNLALGARRAESVRNYLIERGVNAGRIDTISYGKERPIAAGSTGLLPFCSSLARNLGQGLCGSSGTA